MIFELSDSLKQNILFAMENQTVCSVVDAKECAVVEAGEGEVIKADGERFYSLPEWTSADGYALLSDFTEKLHAPLAREELRTVLDSGRGVFRNFKNVLKAYPEVERRWHLYKNKCMNRRILQWYAELREEWGFEKLEESFCDSEEGTEELLEDDFEFLAYDSLRDTECVKREVKKLADEYSVQFSRDVSDALSCLWSENSETFSEKSGFVCRTQSDDFAGCILASFCPSHAKNTVVVTDFFVVQNYRGLGIGRELLKRCIDELYKCGVQWILMGNFIVPPAMESLLSQMGFERLGSGYVANIFKE